MTITTSDRDNRADLWCDGCGLHVGYENCNWFEILDIVASLDWYTISFDYDYGIGYEHFCCENCVD